MTAAGIRDDVAFFELDGESISLWMTYGEKGAMAVSAAGGVDAKIGKILSKSLDLAQTVFA